QTQAEGASAAPVQVRELARDRRLFTEEVPDGHGGLAFSPDGRSLAALGCCDPGSTAVVWDAHTGEERYPITVPGHATTLAFAPSGGLLGIGTGDGHVVVLNARTGARVGAPI